MPKTPRRDQTAKPPEYLAPVADYFKVLSEISRLQILSCLREGAMNVSQIGNGYSKKLRNLSDSVLLVLPLSKF